MSVSIAYGLSNLLPYDATYNDKMEFFKNVASDYVISIHEVIQVRDDAGNDVSAPRLFYADDGEITEKLSPFAKEDADRIHAYSHERTQITYDMWTVLNGVEVFVPYCEFDESWTANIAPKGKLNMAPLSYGISIAESMITEVEDDDEREMWKHVLEIFKGACTHDFFVLASD